MLHYVMADSTKLHICENLEVAQDVVADIEARYDDVGEPEISVAEGRDSVYWDMGGAVSTNWKPMLVNCGEFKFYFYPHQYDTLLFDLNRCLTTKVRAGGFIKLKGPYNCICLSEETAQKILDFLKVHHEFIGQTRNAHLDEFERALTAMANSKFVIPKAPVDSKNLN